MDGQIVGEFTEEGGGELHGGSFEKGRRVGICQQRPHRGAEPGVAARVLCYVRGALIGRQLERPVKNLKDLPPPRGGNATRAGRLFVVSSCFTRATDRSEIYCSSMIRAIDGTPLPFTRNSR